MQTLAEILASHPDDQPPTRLPDMYRPGVTVDELLTGCGAARTTPAAAPTSASGRRPRWTPPGAKSSTWQERQSTSARTRTTWTSGRLTDEQTDPVGDPDPAREDVRLVRLSLICYRSRSLARKERLNANTRPISRVGGRVRPS